MSKDEAKVDLSLKETAPSDELLKWSAHDPEKWDEFKNRCEKEFQKKSELVRNIRQLEVKKRRSHSCTQPRMRTTAIQLRSAQYSKKCPIGDSSPFIGYPVGPITKAI
jgi:uncharacterized protein YeaO (DUF488 family)